MKIFTRITKIVIMILSIIFLSLSLVKYNYSKQTLPYRENSMNLINKLKTNNHLIVKDLYNNDFEFICLTFPYSSGEDIKNNRLLTNNHIKYDEIKTNSEGTYSLIFIKGDDFYQKTYHKIFDINKREYFLDFRIRRSNDRDYCFRKNDIKFSYNIKNGNNYTLFIED